MQQPPLREVEGAVNRASVAFQRFVTAQQLVDDTLQMGNVEGYLQADVHAQFQPLDLHVRTGNRRQQDNRDLHQLLGFPDAADQADHRRIERHRPADDDLRLRFGQFLLRAFQVGDDPHVVAAAEQTGDEIGHIPVLVDDEHRREHVAERHHGGFGNRHGQAEPLSGSDVGLCGGPGRTGDLEPRQRQRKGRQPVAALHPEFALEFGHEVVADRQLQIFLQRHALAAQCPQVVEQFVAVENQLDLPGVEFHAPVRDLDPKPFRRAGSLLPGAGSRPVRTRHGAGPDRNAHLTARPRPAERIGQQNIEDHHQDIAHRREQHAAAYGRPVGDTVLPGIIGECLRDAAGRARNVQHLDIVRTVDGIGRLEFVEHIDQIVDLLRIVPDQLRLPADERVGRLAAHDLLAGTVYQRHGDREFVGQVGERPDARLIDQFPLPLFVERLPEPRPEPAAADQVSRHADNDAQRCGEIPDPGPGRGVGRSQHADRQAADGTPLPGRIVPVAHPERIAARGKRSESQRVAVVIVMPVAVQPLDIVKIGIIAAVDVIQCRDRKTESILMMPQHHPPPAHQRPDIVRLAVGPHLAEPDGRHVGGRFEIPAVGDDHEAVDPAEKQFSPLPVVKIGSVAELDHVKSVRSAVNHRTVRRRVVAHDAGIGPDPDVVERIDQQAVDHPAAQLVVAVIGFRAAARRIVTHQAAAGPEPRRAVRTAHARRHVVHGQPPAGVEPDGPALPGAPVIVYDADTVVAEPEGGIGLLANGEKEVPAPRLESQLHRFDIRGDGRVGAPGQFDAPDPVAHARSPQHPVPVLVKPVNAPQRPAPRQFENPPVPVRVVAHAAVAADPQHIAAASGKRIDRIFPQRRIGGRIAVGILPRKGPPGVEIADAQDAVVLGPDPEVALRVDMERLDRFGQQVGQRFVGDRTDRDLPDRLPQQPAAVGSDPDNILVTVLQQRKNAAVDVDLLQLVTSLDRIGRTEPQHAAHPEGQHVIVLVADHRRKGAAPSELLPQVENRESPPLPGVEAEQHAVPVGEKDRPVAVVTGEHHPVRQRHPLPLPHRSPAAGVIGHLRTTNILRTHQPQYAVAVEAHAQHPVKLLPADIDRLERTLRRHISVQLVAMQEKRLVPAAGREFIDPLESGKHFDPPVARVEAVDTVVGPHPEVTVVRGYDLLNQVAREPEMPGGIAVPQIQSVATARPDIPVRILRQRQNRTVRQPVAVGNAADILRECTPDDRDREEKEYASEIHSRAN